MRLAGMMVYRYSIRLNVNFFLSCLANQIVQNGNFSGYNPETNTWTKVVPMLNRRCRLGVATLNGKLYACGGYDGNQFLRSVEMYDPNKDVWKEVAPMNVKRSRVALSANMG